MAGDILAAEDGAGGWRFPEDELVEAQQRAVELFPDPKHDVFDRRVLDEVVEILMVEQPRGRDRSTIRSIRSKSSIMPRAGPRVRIGPRTATSRRYECPCIRAHFPGMKRQHVRGLEAEMLADLRAYRLSLRPHRFEAPLEVGEEAAGDVAVDDAMVEREARVHHAPDRDRVVVAHDELLDDGLHRDDAGLTAR